MKGKGAMYDYSACVVGMLKPEANTDRQKWHIAYSDRFYRRLYPFNSGA